MRLLRGVALEGGICAGKSTARDWLREHRSMSPVPEFMEVVSGEEAGRVFAPGSRRSIDLFVEAERRRGEHVRGDGPFCLDRSFLPLAACRYAVIRVGLFDAEDLAYSAQVILATSWLCPEKFVFLDVTDELRQQRAKARENEDNIPFPLLDASFNFHFTSYFRKLEDAEYVSFIDNDPRARADIWKRIAHALETPRQIDTRRLRETAVALMES